MQEGSDGRSLAVQSDLLGDHPVVYTLDAGPRRFRLRLAQAGKRLLEIETVAGHLSMAYQRRCYASVPCSKMSGDRSQTGVDRTRTAPHLLPSKLELLVRDDYDTSAVQQTKAIPKMQ